MVYSADGIPSMEAIAAQRCLALLLSNKLKQKYSEMWGFVGARVSLSVVRSNSLVLCGARDKEAYILQRPSMADGAVMGEIVLWRV